MFMDGVAEAVEATEGESVTIKDVAKRYHSKFNWEGDKLITTQSESYDASNIRVSFLPSNSPGSVDSYILEGYFNNGCESESNVYMEFEKLAQVINILTAIMNSFEFSKDDQLQVLTAINAELA